MDPPKSKWVRDGQFWCTDRQYTKLFIRIWSINHPRLIHGWDFYLILNHHTCLSPHRGEETLATFRHPVWQELGHQNASLPPEFTWRSACRHGDARSWTQVLPHFHSNTQNLERLSFHIKSADVEWFLVVAWLQRAITKPLLENLCDEECWLWSCDHQYRRAKTVG